MTLRSPPESGSAVSQLLPEQVAKVCGVLSYSEHEASEIQWPNFKCSGLAD